MPEEFEVVQCFSCKIFQIHQTRKDRKFSCKVCGLKQSRRKVYCVGSAKDCRLAVQQLNSNVEKEEEDFLKGITHTDEDQFTDGREEFDYEQKDHYTESKQESNDEEALIIKPTSSKWTAFLDDDENFPSRVSSDGQFDEDNHRFEIEPEHLTGSTEDPPSFDKFTSVKRYHNSTPKQTVLKRIKVNLSYREENVTPVRNKNRYTKRNNDFESEEYTCTPKTKPHGIRAAVHEYIRSTQEQKKPPSDEKYNEDYKKDAFKKFDQINDDVLDILNKSFYT